MKNVRWGMGACVAALALALSVGVVSAQQKAPDAPAKADAKKAEPPKADMKKAEPVPKASAKKAEPAKKAASACKGVDEAACVGKGECMWVKEYVTKAGVKHKAHCQGKPTPPKKAEPKGDAKKAEPAKGAPAPAAPAPAAPAKK